MFKLLKTKPLFLWEKILYTTLLIGLIGVYTWKTTNTTTNIPITSSIKTNIYETISPQLSESFSTQKFLGRINSNAYAMVHPRRQGIIQDILVDVGDIVQKGQTLAVLLPPGVEGQSSAQIAQAYAALQSAREALMNTQNTSVDSVALAQQNLDNIATSSEGIRSQLSQKYSSGKTSAQQVLQVLQKILFGENLRIAYANGVQGSFNNSQQERRVLSLFKEIDLQAKALTDDHGSIYAFLGSIENLTNEVEILYRDALISSNFHKTKIEMNRSIVLASQSKILLAREKIDTTELQLSTAEQSLTLTSSRAQGSLDAARTRLDVAKAVYNAEIAKSGNIKVISPFSGKITARYEEVGQMVTPMKKLFEIVGAETSLQETSGTEVIFGVAEDFISQISIGQSVELIAPNLSSKRTTGTISRMGDSIDSKTQTATVHASFIEKDFLPHNSSVFVAITMGKNPIFSVPSTALKRKRSEHFLWVSDEEGGFIHLPVTVLAEDGEYSDVFSPHLSLTSDVVIYPSVSLWRTSTSWEESILASKDSLIIESDVE